MGKRGPQPAKKLITAEHVLILEYIRDGKTNPEIAEVLGKTAFWVGDQLKTIFHLLGVQTRAQAVAVSLARGLIRPPRIPRR